MFKYTNISNFQLGLLEVVAPVVGHNFKRVQILINLLIIFYNMSKNSS